MRNGLANALSAVAIETRERTDYRSFPFRQVTFHQRIVPMATRSEQVPIGSSALPEQLGKPIQQRLEALEIKPVLPPDCFIDGVVTRIT